MNIFVFLETYRNLYFLYLKLLIKKYKELIVLFIIGQVPFLTGREDFFKGKKVKIKKLICPSIHHLEIKLKYLQKIKIRILFLMLI